MARFKDFGSGNSSKTSEPVVFKLHGEEFKCLPELQGKTFLDMVSNSASEDPAVSSAVTMGFFEAVLFEESLERFNALISDKEKIVSLETLTDIVGWLIEEYTERPLAQQEDSSTGD
jgi:hypothetical protein